jgi:hypothetical protein
MTVKLLRLALSPLAVLVFFACSGARTSPTSNVSPGHPPTMALPQAEPDKGAPHVDRIDAELEVRRISDDAFLVTHEPFFSSNILIVRMPDNTVVICSSPLETQGTRALVQWVRERFRPRQIIAVNTHFHFDGTGGNEAYRALGVETYASDLTQALLAKKGPSMKEEVAGDFDEPAKHAIE